MKKRYYYLFIVLLLAILSIGYFSFGKKETNHELTINEILKTEAYDYLSDEVKEFIKTHYEETGELYLTEKNYEGSKAYLNPNYIAYLEAENKEEFTLVPPVTTYVPKLTAVNDNLPETYDLRHVNGKNYLTPVKNQGSEGLCWAFATVSILETHDLKEKNKSYDSSAVLFSEKQMDYALAEDGIVGGNELFPSRSLTEGESIIISTNLLEMGLGAVNASWETENSAKVRNNLPLEPNIVFNRNNSNYELDNTTYLPDVNRDLTKTELNNNMKNYIKNMIMKDGGALISVYFSVGNIIENTNGDDVLVNDLNYVEYEYGNHAVHLIGWDDNYNYEFCYSTVGRKYVTSVAYRNGTEYCPTGGDSEGNSFPTTKQTGKGAWIFKNSWGDDYSYVYMPYSSVMDSVIGFDDYSENDWDNAYRLTSSYSENKYYFKFVDEYVANEKVEEVKFLLFEPITFDLYFSENGEESNFVKIGHYSFDYAGHKSIDLSDKNLNVNSNSAFRLSNGSIITIDVYTKNKSTTISAKTSDFVYEVGEEVPTSGNSLQIPVVTVLKNIPDNSLVTYKIKDSSGNYLATSSYTVTLNRSYYGMVTPIIKIDKSIAKKGTFVLETYYNSTLLYSSNITLLADFEPMGGTGTETDPWQITNTRQFNMIRNAPDDAYKLMNDLDFQHDTYDEDGLFYNNGYGWDRIIAFYGNLDGNGKTIKNIKTSSGLIGMVEVTKNCKFTSCGVHDLTVQNGEYTYGGAGIINHLYYQNTYTGNFNNLAVKNVHFKDGYYDSGGIVGSISMTDSVDFNTTILKINNWYSDVRYSLETYHVGSVDSYLGGLVGTISGTGDKMYLSINNAKAKVKIDLTAFALDHSFIVSDGIGIINSSNIHFNLNNFIGNAQYIGDEGDYSSNAFIGSVKGVGSAIKVNGAKSTTPYSNLSGVSVTNSEHSLYAYNLARNSYSGFNYYEDNYFVYYESGSGRTLVTFSDKFNQETNKIPTLKKFPEEYATYKNSISLEIGETLSVNDLITKNSNSKDVKLYSSYNCPLDVCNNSFDSNIISKPTKENGYSFRGLRYGSTSLIIYDEQSGYIDKVIVSVTNANSHTLILDYNHDNIVDRNHFVTTGRAYGELPHPDRFGYNFLGWFTDRTSGTEITSDTIFNGTSDVTLYAHWEEREIQKVKLKINQMYDTSVGDEDYDTLYMASLDANKKVRVYFSNIEELRNINFSFDICNESGTNCYRNKNVYSMQYSQARVQYYYEFTPTTTGNYYIQLNVDSEDYIFLELGFYQSGTLNDNVIKEINSIAAMSEGDYPPVFRMYNPINGEHLYTTDAYEAKVIYKTQGWGYEGIGWYSDKTGTPVYRLYQPQLGNHLYTSDLHEIDVITRTQGWVKDFDGAPVMYSTTDINEGMPVYRLYNQPLNGMHHLTTDENEYNVLPSQGWAQEGISMYVPYSGTPSATEYYNVNF